jgi:DNA-binding MurR/RpiR family transcriptional regulator
MVGSLLFLCAQYKSVAVAYVIWTRPDDVTVLASALPKAQAATIDVVQHLHHDIANVKSLTSRRSSPLSESCVLSCPGGRPENSSN